MEAKKKKGKTIKMNPREPLTKKARAAITTYALLKCGDLRIADFLIKHTLEAERMRREQLYGWLENHGYKWNGIFWIGVEAEGARK